jgi:hypothetical protein
MIAMNYRQPCNSGYFALQETACMAEFVLLPYSRDGKQVHVEEE